MDHRRPVYIRQKSNDDTPVTPASPMMSPLNIRHARAGSSGMSNVKKAQTKAAAQRLAQVMSHQSAPNDDVDDEEDDLSYDYNAGGGIGSIGLAGARKVQPRSPMTKPALRSNVLAKKPYNFVDDEDDDDKIKPAPRTVAQVKTPYRQVDEDNDKTKPVPRTTAQVKTPYQVVDDDNDKTKPALQTNTPVKKPYHIVDDDDDKDDNLDDYSLGMAGKLSTGRAGAKSMRSRSPLAVRTKQEPSQSGTSTTGGRSSVSAKTTEQTPVAQSSSATPPSTTNAAEPVSARKTMTSRLSWSSQDQPLSVRSSMNNRSSIKPSEQPTSAHSASASHPVVKTIPMPSSVPITLKPTSSSIPSESPLKDQRLSLDLGSMKIREARSQHSESAHSESALQDEIDMLQEENEDLIEKLRLAEEKSQEADARAKQLENQISTLGDGVTMEARLLSRKEAALQQREAALRVAEQTNKPEKILALRTEAEAAKDEASSALEQLQKSELELRSLRNIAQRMILTQEEMEEVVLKRCWLARYWDLCVQHGVQAEIAAAKFEYWSSFAPLPNEVVLAAGQRAKYDEDASVIDDAEERERILQEMYQVSGDGYIENMLAVEKGLRELASLKIEDALALALAQKRLPNLIRPDEMELASEEHFDACELSEEEAEDVRFKQAWLMYFWRRAKNHGVEPDIAEERLESWINHSSQSSTSHDAVDVERGIQELRKLSIENQLWHSSREGQQTEYSSKANLESNF